MRFSGISLEILEIRSTVKWNKRKRALCFSRRWNSFGRVTFTQRIVQVHEETCFNINHFFPPPPRLFSSGLPSAFTAYRNHTIIECLILRAWTWYKVQNSLADLPPPPILVFINLKFLGANWFRVLWQNVKSVFELRYSYREKLWFRGKTKVGECIFIFVRGRTAFCVSSPATEPKRNRQQCTRICNWCVQTHICIHKIHLLGLNKKKVKNMNVYLSESIVTRTTLFFILLQHYGMLKKLHIYPFFV